MKLSIIEAVTQTQFDTCDTPFIALDFKLRREKLLAFGLEIISKLDSYFLMTVKPGLYLCLALVKCPQFFSSVLTI